jgi:opacity protein-like surface antigen
MKKTLLLLSLVLAVGSAVAGQRIQTGPYLTIGANYAAQTDMVPNDAGEPGGALAFGLQISPEWAVEVGYAQLGERTRSSNLDRAKWDALSLATVGRIDLSSSVDFIGKIGVARTTISGPETQGAFPGVSQSGYVYGAGLDFKLSREWAARVLVEKYTDFAGSKSDLNSVSLGLRYQF